MLPYSFRFSRIILFAFFLFAVLYGLFEAQGILLGPRIEIDGMPVHVTTDFVRIQGVATHIASISMNGAEIPVTATGAFDEPYLLGPGENRVEFVAKDKYGNTTTKTVVLYYEATSTPASISPTTPTAPKPVSPTSTTTATTTVAD